MLDLAVGADQPRLAQPAFSLCRLLGEDVALEGLHALDLACPRELEALSRASMTFHFRHFSLSIR